MRRQILTRLLRDIYTTDRNYANKESHLIEMPPKFPPFIRATGRYSTFRLIEFYRSCSIPHRAEMAHRIKTELHTFPITWRRYFLL